MIPRKQFTPRFSDRSRDLARIASLEAQITAERDARMDAERQVERLASDNRRLRDNLLNVNFEARVAKGCYSRCPIGRIAG